MTFKSSFCLTSKMLCPKQTLQSMSFTALISFYCRHQNVQNAFGKSTILKPNMPTDMLQECSSHCDAQESFSFGDKISATEKKNILNSMLIVESFLSIEEEKSLLNEIEPYMKRLRYEFDHWDNAIHGFRETERSNWNPGNSKIIDRVRDCAFLPESPQLRHVHVLDLAEEGYIKPHIDSARFCGNTIAGLSLLTSSIMRMVHHEDSSKTFDVLLKRRSLYIMRDSVRYDYTHEILPNKDSVFKNQKVEKKRRISIICRNEPSPS